MKKMKLIITIFLLLVMNLFGCSTTITVKPPISHDECVGQDYVDVKNQLTAAGFTNFIVAGEVDGIFDMEAEENTIKKISIDGNENFSVSEVFSPDVPIKISYHMKAYSKETMIDENMVKIPFSSKDILGNEYTNVLNKLEDAGFTNIKVTEKIVENESDKIGNVDEITIGGDNEFKKGDKFNKDVVVRVIYNISSKNSSIKDNEISKTINTKSNNYEKDEFKFDSINDKKDILGTWVQMNVNNESFYYAAVDEDTITIFYCYDEDELPELYWTGSFNSNIDIKKRNEIVSENYKYITDNIGYSSHADNKKFIYENGMISYDATYLGVNENVILGKDSENWVTTVKLTGNRQEGYNVNTNNKIEVGGLEISYPYYYDSKDETSTNEDMIFYPSENSAVSNLEIVNIVLEEKIVKDDMVDFVYMMFENEQNRQMMEQKEIVVDGINGVQTLYNAQNGLGMNAMFLVNEGMEVVMLDVYVDYSDKSINNYIKDFESIINNIKQVSTTA